MAEKSKALQSFDVLQVLMDRAPCPLHGPCTSGLPCSTLVGEGVVAAAAQQMQNCALAVVGVWQQDELLSNGRKVEAALLISLFISWYRLISHRLLP